MREQDRGSVPVGLGLEVVGFSPQNELTTEKTALLKLVAMLHASTVRWKTARYSSMKAKQTS